MHTCVYVCTFAWLHVCVCENVCVHICTDVSMCIFIFVCIYMLDEIGWEKVYLWKFEIYHAVSETETDIFKAIMEGSIDFTSDPWPYISPQAKDLIKRMLKQNPKERLTPQEILSIYSSMSLIFCFPFLSACVFFSSFSSNHYSLFFFFSFVTEWSVDFVDHPWIRIDGEAPDKPLDNVVLTRMKQFRAMNKLKKLALKV